MVIAMHMRVWMCLIFAVTFMRTDVYDQSFGMFELKIYILSYQLPHYFFMMVTIALLFSAHTMYTSIRELLFPELKSDDQFHAVKLAKSVNIPTKSRFYCIQSIILVSLMIEACAVLTKTSRESFSGFAYVSLITLDVCLYLCQIAVIIGGFVIRWRLKLLSKARPACEVCVEDAPMCE